MIVDLEQQQVSLAEVQLSDFRSRNLIELVASHVVPGSALDVGCGGGGMVSTLLQRGHTARGIDASEAIISAAQAFLKSRGHDSSCITLTALSELVAAGQQFDNVISMDCLEHQADDRPLFHELVQSVRVGGRLLITVPAMPQLFSERDRIVGHYRRYTRKALLALAEAETLRVDELRYWNIVGAPPTFISGVLLKRPIDESFRYGSVSLPKRVLRSGLSAWFEHVENRMRPPFGMTLFMAATRLGG